MKRHFVSIIVPCRNEKGYIKNFLESIVSQNYPKENLEVLISDGMSDDGTREIIKKYQKKYPFIKLLDNPKKYTPSALNIAVKESKGDIIIRLDSHARYEKDYISKCVYYLNKYHADNVGGTMKTTPANNTLTAKSIALCMSHGFSVGNSYFRKGSAKPRSVDTVFGGCYRREVFNKIGFFNENLKRSQDLDFNIRLKKAGGKIILVPDMVSYYYPKATFKDFLKHNFEDGQWAILPLRFTKNLFSARHYVPLFFVSLIIFLFVASFFWYTMFFYFSLILGFYFLIILLNSFIITFKERDIRYLFSMPIAFIIRHFCYGFGSLVGIIKLLF